MSTAFKRKSISIDSDLITTLEADAAAEGRSLSNLVNRRLRLAMRKAKARNSRKQKGATK